MTKLLKVYIPNLTENLTKLGGGFTFLRNFKKGLYNKIEFVDSWQECDIIFVFGITTIDKAELHTAINFGKKLVLRVDNIPRKSRNKRQSPAERLTEFGNKAAAVVYQSKWCKEYAGYFITNKHEFIINNGVDTSIFNTKNRNSDGKTYLYINYNDNPNKRFDEALYRFDMLWRLSKKIGGDAEPKLIIAGNAPKIYTEHPEYDWDLPTPGKVEYVGITDTPEKTAELMRRCDCLIYPSFCEAYPNTALEALACGMDVGWINEDGGTKELIENNKDKIKTIQEMCEEYYNLFISLC